MADESYQSATNGNPYDGGQPASSTPYVRARPAHRSVEPIDDFANQADDIDQYVSHDSDYTIRGNAFEGASYRRSRAQQNRLRRDLHYGQYLEIPKGRRDIFVSRERRTRVKTFIALVAVLAVLAVVSYFLWGYLEATWGSAT